MGANQGRQEFGGTGFEGGSDAWSADIHVPPKLAVAHSETRGQRPTMEDASITDLAHGGQHDCHVCALFDGHGGSQPARYAAARISTLLRTALNANPTVEEALVSTFSSLDAGMASFADHMGTTALVLLIQPSDTPDQPRVGWVANLGDTRCVVCRRGGVERLSVDHRPTVPAERKAVEERGGMVFEGRVLGTLAVSRALGDMQLAPAVGKLPDIRRIDISDDIEFFILACDGVWDVLSDEEAVECVKREVKGDIGALQEGADALVEEALIRGSRDNVSVIIAVPL